MASLMTKTERSELRTLLRAQFKVLRADVDQRAAELLADAEQRVVDRYAETDAARARLTSDVALLVDKWQTEFREIVEAQAEACGGVSGIERLTQPRIVWLPDRRMALRAAFHAGIVAQAKDAKLRLDRLEVDFLRRLTADAIETSAATEFLRAIPAIGDLVPAARLAELEAQFDGTDPARDLDQRYHDRQRFDGDDFDGMG